MDKYQKKQFKIALAYLLIIIVIIGGIYLVIKPGLPSCSDGIQNQGEVGVDCGDPCSPCSWQLQDDLEIISTKAIPTQNNYVDLVAKIKNPNSDFGAKSFSYIFKLYDSQNNLIASKEGVSYILPLETTNIIEQKILVDYDIVSVEFMVTEVDWQELIDYEEPEFLIRNIDFNQDENLTRAYGALENRSNYDFNTVNIWVVLLDESSNTIGLGKTELKTILSNESRYFEFSWFFPLKAIVSNLDVSARTNVFLDDNFMRRYGGERERFQEY